MSRSYVDSILNPVMIDVENRRNELRGDSNCRFVSWSEFCNMLVSRSFLERSDDSDAAVLGLTNSSNNCRFLIETEKVGN